MGRDQAWYFYRFGQYIERAEIIREKGTNRSQFFRGEVDKYTWVDIGSSYLPSEIIAAFLWAQLQEAEAMVRQRMTLWETYHEAFCVLETQGRLRRPVVPQECRHNAHMYYILLPTADLCRRTLRKLAQVGINAVFHYVPLHSSPAGKKFGRAAGDLACTEDVSARLIRLPLWVGMTPASVARVVEAVQHAC